jgi:hypothetical protein
MKGVALEMKQTMKKHGMLTGVFVLAVAFLLATAMPAGASVVYTDMGSGYTLAVYEDYYIDADSDGNKDFQIHYDEGSLSYTMPLRTNPSHNNEPLVAYGYLDENYPLDFAEAFYNGEEIGTNEQWVDYSGIDYYGISTPDGSIVLGEWQDMPDYTAYSGFKFYSTLDEDWHYGWVLMEIDWENNSETTLYGYAWETDPNTAIIAGDTGSPVPVPAAVWLMGSGLVSLVGIRRKRNG